VIREARKMIAIGGRNPHRSNQQQQHRYEQFVADYEKKVGTYPAMLMALSPNNGVPTGEVLDTFHKTTADLGVTICVKAELNKALPIKTHAYKQLLNTIASIVHNPLGFMDNITTIDLVPFDKANVYMSENSILMYGYPSNSLDLGILDDIEHLSLDNGTNSLRNVAICAEHEGIHAFLAKKARDLMGLDPKTMNAHDLLVLRLSKGAVVQKYMDKLTSKNPRLMAEAPTILTDYYKYSAEELFTTLFEAYASEVAHRTVITEEMANAVGSTVEHLEARKRVLLPSVSDNQRKILKALLTLVNDTPLDLENWILNHRIGLGVQYDLFRQLSHDSPLLRDDERLDSLFALIGSFHKTYPSMMKQGRIKKSIDTLYPAMPIEDQSLVRTLVSLMNPNLITLEQQEVFIRTSPKVLEDLVININKALSAETENKALLGDVGNSLGYYLFCYISHCQNDLPAFVAWKKQLLQKSVDILGTALDVPQQFIRLLESMDEKALMVTMLHRLV
jgi:hypothetical protein